MEKRDSHLSPGPGVQVQAEHVQLGTFLENRERNMFSHLGADWDHNRKRMLKPGMTLSLYLNGGQILLRVGPTHHAAGDVALVPQPGAGVAASGGGKGTLEGAGRLTC